MGKYFFVDFDNTIFSHRTNKIPQSTLQAFRDLRQAGHKFFIASGRRFGPKSVELTEYALSPDGFISSNGAFVETEGKLLSESYMDPGLQKRLLDYVLKKDYCLSGVYDNKRYVSNAERFFLQIKGRRYSEALFGRENFFTLYHVPMPSFFLADSDEAIEDVQAHFPELKLLSMGSELGGADVVPMANSKANGMSVILNYYGAPPEDAVAVGDSMNDLEMIRRAHLGIAMGNAMQAVKEAADYIAPDIDEDGLSDAVGWALSQG